MTIQPFSQEVPTATPTAVRSWFRFWFWISLRFRLSIFFLNFLSISCCGGSGVSIVEGVFFLDNVNCISVFWGWTGFTLLQAVVVLGKLALRNEDDVSLRSSHHWVDSKPRLIRVRVHFYCNCASVAVLCRASSFARIVLCACSWRRTCEISASQWWALLVVEVSCHCESNTHDWPHQRKLREAEKCHCVRRGEWDQISHKCPRIHYHQSVWKPHPARQWLIGFQPADSPKCFSSVWSVQSAHVRIESIVSQIAINYHNQRVKAVNIDPSRRSNNSWLGLITRHICVKQTNGTSFPIRIANSGKKWRTSAVNLTY